MVAIDVFEFYFRANRGVILNGYTIHINVFYFIALIRSIPFHFIVRARFRLALIGNDLKCRAGCNCARASCDQRLHRECGFIDTRIHRSRIIRAIRICLKHHFYGAIVFNR